MLLAHFVGDDCFMKRTPDQFRYWSETNKIIGDQLRAYYRACATEELPPQLLETLKKLDEEIEPSAEQVWPRI
jgi:hypothetical protein